MSSKIELKKINNLEHVQEFKNIELFPNISSLIIPFSNVFESRKTPDIYNGEELIPFEKKDLKFRQILIHEFLDY